MNGGQYFKAAGATVFNTRTSVLRPRSWTSCDAAGLSVLAGLCRGDEVFETKYINHPIRFTMVSTKNTFVLPATHYASSLSGVNYMPMGARLRMKSSVDVSYFPEQARIIAQGLKKFGIILADNGLDWDVCGAADSRWNWQLLNVLQGVNMINFEIVQRGTEYR